MSNLRTEHRICNIVVTCLSNLIYEEDCEPERCAGYALAAPKNDYGHDVDIDKVLEYYKDALSQVGKI